MRRFVGALALASTLGCGDSTSPDMPPAAALFPASAASFSMTAIILGPVASDDDADLRVTLSESAGVSARVNFLRMTCSNGAVREWGPGKIQAAAGTNRASASSRTVIVVHYTCPSSSRPRELVADIGDDNGFHHQIVTSPFHPDWPGT